MTFWTNSPLALATAAAAVVLSVSQPASAQVSGQKLGKVHFETSCTPAAQKAFDQGMLYQHSFWYRSSKQSFEDALKADPNCAIAYWGIGLSLLNNPHAPPPPANLPLGLEATQKAKA